MRLINTHTLELAEFTLSAIPRYAILSHTWEENEIPYQEMISREPGTLDKQGYTKIKQACRQSLNDAFEWIWVDTCCIDKTSSAELSEAINSMFNWYKRSDKCYVYLSDLEPQSQIPSDIQVCRWFTRGWTLQELIAPKDLIFYDRSWQAVGTKAMLLQELSEWTGISEGILQSNSRLLITCPVATRMSWARRRQTTRIEDRAYSLLGIFDINMPLLYGEEHKAFRRLQEEIIKNSNDLTIFAWERSMNPVMGLDMIAPYPEAFGAISGIDLSIRTTVNDTDFSLTNKGLYFTAEVHLEVIEMRIAGEEYDGLRYCFGFAQHTKYFKTGHPEIGVCLRKLGPKLYCRDGSYLIGLRETRMKKLMTVVEKSFYIATEEKQIRWHLYNDYRQYAIRVPPQPGWTLLHASPTTLWDATDQIFLKVEPTPTAARYRDTVLGMFFTGRLGGTSIAIFVLCTSNFASDVPNITVIKGDVNSILYRMMFTSSYFDHGVNVFQLPDAGSLLNQASQNSLRIKVDKKTYDVRASFTVDRWESETRPFMVRNLGLHTERV